MKKIYPSIITVTVLVLMLLFVFCTVLNRAVIFEASLSNVFERGTEKVVSQVYDAIVVLGAGLKADGTPSDILEDRLKGAIALYNVGVSEVIVLSGDNSGSEYDEVSAMERYCIYAGIPREAIVRDDRGFSTYETIFNSVNSLGYRKIIIVTQKYHIWRALYIAHKMGADADGFCTDYRNYRSVMVRNLREYAARVKDFFQVTALKK